MEMKNKIDIVVPWVDGTDEKWQQERLKINESVILNDYRDWDIFKFWFRAIEKNAPWVNNIYFVTWGHLPNFLNVNHPKLKIINHKDYIPEEYLPTFSANTIELNLHRINGLSEQFIYFNDDTFLLNKAKPSDFFKYGKPRDSAVIVPIAPSRYHTISNLMINNIGIINEHFKKHEVIKKNPFKWYNIKYRHLVLLNIIAAPWKKFYGLYEQHLPTSFLKSTFEEVWEKEFEILDATCRNQVRDFKVDVNQWLIKEWQIASGNFEPRSIGIGNKVWIENLKDAETAADKVINSDFKLFCLNDHVKNQEEIDEIISVVSEALERKFPEKSSFEL